MKDVINRILEENLEYTVILGDTVVVALFTGDRNVEEIHPKLNIPLCQTVDEIIIYPGDNIT